MKTQSSKKFKQKDDPVPQVIVSERMRQEMLAIAVRNQDAFLAIRQRLDADTMRRVSQPFAVIWKATLDYYEKNETLPDHPLLSAEVSRIIEDEDFVLSQSQHDHLNDLVELVFDDTSYKTPVETSREHYKWAVDTAQKLLTQLAADQFKDTLTDPASLLEMPAILQAMTEQVGAIRSMATVASGDLFATGWDIQEQKPTFSTGVKIIDGFIGGMRAGEVYGFMGPYGSCKTTIAVQAIAEASKQCSTLWAKALADHELAVTAWEDGGCVGPAPPMPAKPMAFYASYETPIQEFRERCLAFVADVPRNRLMGMDHRGVMSLRGPEEEPLDYEKEKFADVIESKFTFPSERERVVTEAARLNQFIVFIDMTGKTVERQQKGKGGVAELAVELKMELKERNARLYCLWLDHAASMCEEEMIQGEKDSSERRVLLRRIPKMLGNLIAGPMNGAVFVLQQLSGEANNRGSSSRMDHTDADECKSFGMYLDFALTCTRPNAEQVCIVRCTKHRRTPPMPHKFVRIVGDYNRVDDVSEEYTMEGGGLGIVSKAMKGNVATHESMKDIADTMKQTKKKTNIA